MQVILDSHPDHILLHPYDQIYGWVERPFGTELAFRLGGEYLASTTYARPDLDSKLAAGFAAFVDLVDLCQKGITGGTLALEITESGRTIHSVPFDVRGTNEHDLRRIHAQKLLRRRFVERHWDDRELRGHDGIRALYALPDGWCMEPRPVGNSDLVCRHHYDAMIHEFLRGAGRDAMFVEIGAGLRFTPVENVITVEIYDYPSTDVLAVAESLPFQSDTFDGALALNVLEHVRDPFRCARELSRVVKPGGKIYVMLPFLAPEHGYPSHYFNATRFGVRELFAQCTVEKQFLHPSNHPIGMLAQVLLIYGDGLPPDVRTQFWEMSASELMALDNIRDHPVVQALDGEVAWRIAWATTTVFRNDR